MAVIVQKYTFLEYGLDEDFITQLKDLFPIVVLGLESSIKYLGYFLKRNNYLKED